MKRKSSTISFTLILIILVFLGPIANANVSFAKEIQSERFELTSDACLELANQSNIDLDSIWFSGDNFISQISPIVIYNSDFIIIENETHFLDLLSITDNRIESGSKLYFPNDIRIDLSGKYGTVIEENVTLLGARGVSGKIGTAFYTMDFSNPSNYVAEKPMFSVIGNNVTISSLIFEGPAPIGDPGDFDWKEGRYGIEVNHDSTILESNIEILNNEFYGFGHAGISIEKTFTSDIWNSKVRIEHNFIHDNMQFQSGISGTGYGIVINDAYPVMQYNEFGLNRHDVAHTGYFHGENSNYVSGYEFAYNLLHLGATDHLVDVHCYGKENSTNCEDYAGDFVHIHNNLFFDSQVAIAVRGAPTIGVCIYDNEFVVSELQFLERKSSQGNFGKVYHFDNLFEQENNFIWADADKDGIGDRSDSDDDNDGVLDTSDAFPLNSSESMDSDSDGIGNNADIDDDNDGVLDTSDAFPLNSSESMDSDSDGIGNNADIDDDNDGVLDTSDAFPINASKWDSPIDEDFYQVNAQSTGVLIYQVLIITFVALLIVMALLKSAKTENSSLLKYMSSDQEE